MLPANDLYEELAAHSSPLHNTHGYTLNYNDLFTVIQRKHDKYDILSFIINKKNPILHYMFRYLYTKINT